MRCDDANEDGFTVNTVKHQNPDLGKSDQKNLSDQQTFGTLRKVTYNNKWNLSSDQQFLVESTVSGRSGVASFTVYKLLVRCMPFHPWHDMVNISCTTTNIVGTIAYQGLSRTFNRCAILSCSPVINEYWVYVILIYCLQFYSGHFPGQQVSNSSCIQMFPGSID